MPLIDSQPDALSKIYAESLYELAEAEGGRERLEAMNGELDEVVELTRQIPELSEFMASKIVPIDARQKSIDVIFGGRVSDLLLKFLHVLNRKERLSSFLPVASAFDQLVQENFGRVEVNIYTPIAPDAAEVDRGREMLKQAIGREPVVHVFTDPTMLGGVKVQIGDNLIDASLATRLRRMRDILTSEGSTTMRERFEQAYEDESAQ